jgi:hypothetical protein|tara:strand:- start:146 stop:727 length:582 start_codon:yes stop_codon:yes gene_type:complete
MGYQLADGTKLPLDVAWTDPDGIQRPSNWLRLSTEQDRELLGITWVVEGNLLWDKAFYWGYDSDNNLIPKQLDDATDDDGNVTPGLKTLWKARQDDTAGKLLASSDWRVIKAKETSTNIPSTWKTYRAAVRTACNTRQGEIDACSDVAALKELMTGDSQIQQTDDNGLVFDSDGNAVMVANPNLATAWPDEPS